MTIALIVMGVVAGIGGIIYAAVQAEKKRKEALRFACQTMGREWEDALPTESVGDFGLFGHRANEIKNVSRGALGGMPSILAEYSYTVSTGKSNHTVRQTIVVFLDGLPALPDFELSPENVLHKLVSALGYQDIDFERFEEFSKRYLLRGQDEEAVRRVFTPDALMLLGSQPGWTVQAKNGRLLVFRAGKTTKPAELPIFAADALRIAGALGARARA